VSATVQVERAWKGFGGSWAVRDVSFEVEQGEVVCLIGPSGAGKSTLLRCVNHLESLDYGRIFVDGVLVGFQSSGQTIKPLKDKEVRGQRREIGMVFQQFNLFPHMTALENVALGPRFVRGLTRADATRLAVEQLSKVGLRHKATAYPGQMSGGEQQRTAIARALAMEPKVMLFDEPTSALDPETVGEVLEAMRQLARDGMTMLIATHEMGFAREVADTVVFLDQGAIVESGSAGEVLNRPKQERTVVFLRRILTEQEVDHDGIVHH